MSRHFISYSSSDGEEFALRLRDELEEGTPAIPAWLDKRDIDAGQDWDEETARALKSCISLIFVMTRDSVEDEECKNEWTYALRYKKPIIPVKLHADAEAPFRLAQRKQVDFTSALESDAEFSAALARLRKRLESLASPAGVLQALKDRLSDAQRDLRRARSATQKERIKEEIAQLRKDIAKQEEAVREHRAARRGEENAANGPESGRKGEHPPGGQTKTPPGDMLSAGPSGRRRSGIFICYRREDASGHAGRLHDRLSDLFGKEQVFMDIDTIEPGDDFVSAIEEAVSSCGVLLAVIGRNWLNVKDEGGQRRLDNDEDFVRLELVSALEKEIRIIPVLVQGATMPRARDLPDSLSKLARRSALELSDTRWKSDLERLLETLRRIR